MGASAETEAKLLAAMIAVVGERGYAESDLEEVLAEAGLDQEDFAAHFRSKAECFVLAVDALLRQLEADLVQSIARGGDLSERVRIGIDVLAERLTSEPGSVEVLFVDPAINVEPARQLVWHAEQRLARELARGRAFVARGDELPPSIGLLALGAGLHVLEQGLRAPARSSLEALKADVYFAVLLPFVGPEEALESARRSYRGNGSGAA
jgi:AcrR family transcriptional regulator